MSAQVPGEEEDGSRPASLERSIAGVATSPATRYRPLLLLGHGGMGSVEAVAEELDDGTTRVVALKRILRTATTDASRLEMFMREARLTTLLDHPNVIRSLAYGESAGEVFLAMEYVAGEPLSRLIAAARERGEVLPVPLIAFILAEACEGLHAAHELCGPDGEPLGVVHRDVSPHNVMVGYDGRVRLLDFGVAKVDLLESAARTKTGEVKGKTAYMSPEQAMGDAVDRRSDLYSMGAVLFECLTGQRMWGNGTDFDVLRRLALEDAPHLADVMPKAPPGLAALQAQLIEREPSKRPATAHELATRLREFAEHATAGPGAAGAGMRGDAAGVRSAMTHLFDGERQRREALLAEALGASDPTAPGQRTHDARLGPGESAPAFVTHRGAAAPAGGRRNVAAAAAIAAILGGTVGLLYRGSSTHEAPRAGASAVETTRGAVPATLAPASPASSALVVPPDRSDRSEPSRASGAVSAPATRPPSPVVRRLATPRAGVPSAQPSAAIHPPTPAPKPPEPPDVDPTPF